MHSITNPTGSHVLVPSSTLYANELLLEYTESPSLYRLPVAIGLVETQPCVLWKCTTQHGFADCMHLKCDHVNMFS